MSDLWNYWDRTESFYGNERGKKCFKVVKYIDREGILEKPMNYEKFIKLMEQLRKVLFV